MKKISLLIFIQIIVFSLSNSNFNLQNIISTISLFKDTINKLPSKSNCMNSLQNMLSGQSQFGLVPFLMRTGKGINDLGDYYACINDPHSTYISMRINGLPIVLALGLCLPADCQPSDFDPLKPTIAKIVSNLANSIKDPETTFDTTLTENDVRFTNPKQAAEKFNIYGPGFYLTSIILCLFIIFCIVATIYVNSEDIDKSKIHPAIKAFDLSNNIRMLLEDSRKDAEDLKVLDGTRVIMISWIIYGHIYFTAQDQPAINPTGMSDLLADGSKAFIYNATLSVDVFFFMSGFLLSYILLRKIIQYPKVSWLIYIHRIIRLYPELVLILVLYCFIWPALGDGPLYYRVYEKVSENCTKQWWKILLFLENTREYTCRCIDWTWYIANDFQFFIFSPFIVVLYAKSRKWAFFAMYTVILLSFAATIYVALYFDIWACQRKFRREYDIEYYDKPYCRIPTYIIGLIVGFAYYEYKFGTKDQQIIHKISAKIRESMIIRLAMYALGLLGMYYTVTAIHFMDKNIRDIPRWLDMIYLVLARPVFIISFVLFIWPAIIGKGRMHKLLLGNYPMFVLGKLTYGVYMLQQLIMEYFKYEEKKAIYLDPAVLLIQFWAYWGISYIAATITLLFFEQPIFNLERLLFPDQQRIKKDALSIKNKKDEETKTPVEEEKQNILKS